MFDTQKRLTALEKQVSVLLNCVSTLQMASLAMGADLAVGRNLFISNKRGAHAHIALKKMPRKHKKHTFHKACEACGKGYRGNIGLGIHMSKVHGIKGKYVTKVATQSN